MLKRAFVAVGVLLLGKALAEGGSGIIVTLLPKEGLYQLLFTDFIISFGEGRDTKNYGSWVPQPVGDGLSVEFEDDSNIANVKSFKICAFGEEGSVLHLPLERSLLEQTPPGEDGKKRVTLRYGKKSMNMKEKRSKKIPLPPQDVQRYVCDGSSSYR